MRLTRLIGILGIAFLFAGQSLFAQTREERKERLEKAVDERLESGRFTIDVTRAVPMSGQAVNLTSPYSLELRGDTIVSYLPYYGRAYTAPYGGGEGLRFEEKAFELARARKKSGSAELKFRVRTKEDVYAFQVEVFPGGSSTISVTPVNKQGITFYGEVAPREGE